MNVSYELIVIGGGPAGMAAAYGAWRHGLRRILVIERDGELGGILNQCIHNGFGLHYFKEELTGPEFAERFINMLAEAQIDVLTGTTVLELAPGRKVHAVGSRSGYNIFAADSIVLAMGCRERTRGAINIPGTRPAGVLTAGAAQRLVNIEGYMVGKRVVILGSGDIGLIMARRLTLEGAKVLACVEVMPYSGGITRNIVQCLEDYNIPLYLSHTITDIRGNRRVEQVVVSKVDDGRQPIPGTEIVFDCDTVMLSVGLVPENELSRAAGINLDSRTNGPTVRDNMETSAPGIFACGNVLHVHDIVDFVTAEGERAGAAAAAFVTAQTPPGANLLRIVNGDGVTYTVPQTIDRDNMGDSVAVFFRPRRIFRDSHIVVEHAGGTLKAFKRPHMMPGEMERVNIARDVLAGAAGEITISCKELET